MTFYIPQHFRVEDPDMLLAFMQAHGFVDLVSTADGALQVSHVPVLTRRERDERSAELVGRSRYLRPGIVSAL
jgi:predicted FMN-binding regulatory protein PaiB